MPKSVGAPATTRITIRYDLYEVKDINRAVSVDIVLGIGCPGCDCDCDCITISVIDDPSPLTSYLLEAVVVGRGRGRRTGRCRDAVAQHEFTRTAQTVNDVFDT